MSSFDRIKKPRFNTNSKAHKILGMIATEGRSLEQIWAALGVTDHTGARRKVFFVIGVLLSNGLAIKPKGDGEPIFITDKGRAAYAHMDAGHPLENLDFSSWTGKKRDKAPA